MKQSFGITFLLLSITMSTAMSAQGQARKFNYYGDTITVNEILIHKQVFRDGPEAILITNDKEIMTLVKLFSNNRMTASHLCGAHLGIEFRESGAHSHEVFVNLECDEYIHDTKAILEIANAYDRKLREHPTHYQYNVQIRSGTTASAILDKMKGTGFTFYMFPEDKKVKPPNIRIIGPKRYSKAIAGRLRELFKFIKSVSPVKTVP